MLSPWFYIAVFVAVQSYNIDLPPLDEHSWRQTITLGGVRSFDAVGYDFFHPRTIVCDSRDLIIATEAPIYNSIVYAVYQITGEQNWVFRLINILTFSIGLLSFFSFVRLNTDHRLALFALVTLAFSICLVYSRKAMPDTFAVAWALMAVHAGNLYLKHLQWRHLLIFAAAATIGLLSKIPAAIVLSLLLIPFFDSRYTLKSKVVISVVSIAPVSIALLWYFWWVPQLEGQGMPLFFPISLTEGYDQLALVADHLRERFTYLAFKNPISFWVGIVGLALMFLDKRMPLIIGSIGGITLTILFMLKVGETYAVHEYYVIPSIPIMSIWVAFALSSIKMRYTAPILAMILAVWSIQEQYKDYEILPIYESLASLPALVDQHIPKDARVAINSRNIDPTMMYAAGRRGWNVYDRWQDTTYIAGEGTVGLDYLIYVKASSVAEYYPHRGLIYEDEDFIIYKNVYTSQ